MSAIVARFAAALPERSNHLKKALLEAKIEQVSASLKDRAGDKNVISFGCKIQTISRKGSVDYKKIDTLKDVDLDQYRKPASTYQKISYEKEI